MNENETKRKQSEKLLPLIKAFVDGKTIQKFERNEWRDIDVPYWEDNVPLRIKPEVKIRPYTFDEMCKAIVKHGTLVRYKNDNAVFSVILFCEDYVSFLESSTKTYKEFTKNVWLDDNSPCGILEEE